MSIPFLSATWRNLLVITYKADVSVLRRYLPSGTEIDTFNDTCYVSLVAFQFEKNKLFGLIPSYPSYNFSEINLRFYVKRHENTEVRRGVTFIKEIVPSHLISLAARLFYNEPYIARKMISSQSGTEQTQLVHYGWKEKDKLLSFTAQTSSALRDLTQGSLEEFILEHYWGYTAQADASTYEYQVVHPRWRYRPVDSFEISENIKSYYGKSFQEIFSSNPVSVLIAKGSPVTVSFPRRIPHKHQKTSDGVLGWVLYDGSCGFCSWWIPFWRNSIKKAGYDVAAVQSPWVKEKIGINSEELNQDIRLLLSDGTLINGADAYIYGMKSVWWSKPIGILLGLPLIRQITWGFYRFFNRNRFLVSRVCKFKPDINP